MALWTGARRAVTNRLSCRCTAGWHTPRPGNRRQRPRRGLCKQWQSARRRCRQGRGVDHYADGVRGKACRFDRTCTRTVLGRPGCAGIRGRSLSLWEDRRSSGVLMCGSCRACLRGEGTPGSPLVKVTLAGTVHAEHGLQPARSLRLAQGDGNVASASLVTSRPPAGQWPAGRPGGWLAAARSRQLPPRGHGQWPAAP